MKSWKQYFIDLTIAVASKSKDPSRQVGCVIVGPDSEIRSTGFNGFPRGVRETSNFEHEVVDVDKDIQTQNTLYKCSCGKIIEDKYSDDINKVPAHFGDRDKVLSRRWDRPQKYQYVEHAERNAIYNAARMGVPLNGCIAFVSLAPCVGCSRALAQAGIVEVYGPAFPAADDITYTEYHFDIAQIILQEAGINYYGTEYAPEDTA